MSLTRRSFLKSASALGASLVEQYILEGTPELSI